MKFRTLKPEEIEIRVGSAKENGGSLLLFQNSRVAMDLLDENELIWQREHKVINNNLYCGISIWNDKINQFVIKWDVGTQSNTEKEKGEASDSFKRAAVNWGIGRELYTSPFIWVQGYQKQTKRKDKYNNPIYAIYEKFKVKEIECDNKKVIKKLVIVDSKGIQVYPKQQNNQYNNNIINQTQQDVIKQHILSGNIDGDKFMKYLDTTYDYQSINQIEKDQYNTILSIINRSINNKQK